MHNFIKCFLSLSIRSDILYSFVKRIRIGKLVWKIINTL